MWQGCGANFLISSIKIFSAGAAGILKKKKERE